MPFKLKQSNIVSSAPINKIKMEDGVLGKANRDGTIDINKDITDPQQEREVIEHEKMHLEQMQIRIVTGKHRLPFLFCL